jgi:flavin-dependent dehydrogenase
MTPEVDLVVAGAGPAGLAAASYAARAGMNVVVLDPHHGVIDKACGEGIMPGGVEALDDLGIRPVGIPFLGIRYADAFDSELHAFGKFPEGHGLGVRRTVLQATMKARAAALGVRFEEGRVRSFEQLRDGVLVNEVLHTRWLIGADGLRSRIRRFLGVERSGRKCSRLGLRRHYAVPPWSEWVEVYFGDHAEAYVTPVDPGLVGVAFLFESGAGADRQFFDEMLEQFPVLAGRLSYAPVASRLRGAGPFEQRVARRVVGNVMLVGDAAGYVDPLTGDGIALGLATARAAVTSLLESAPSAYEARYQRITRRYAIVTSLLLAIARRRRLHRPVLRAARTLPHVFDDVLGMLGHLPREGETGTWLGGGQFSKP